MSSCNITFDNNPTGVYFAGQLVSGKAVLQTTKSKTIRGIYIVVQGAAVVWPKGCLKINNVTRKATEQYFFSKSYVVGEQQADPTEYPAGVRTFNFECPLPSELPSSLTLEFASISYSVQLTIERPWRFDNSFRQPLTILSVFDLNLHPDLKMPVNVEHIENFYGLTCKPKPLKLTYQMPASGYVSGEKIPFILTVENTTSFDCQEAKLEIRNYIEVISIHAKSKEPLKEKWNVAETILGPIPRESNRQFKGVIEIPSLLPSTCDLCSIISGYYMVCVTIHTPFYREKVQLETPLHIGTVPFQDIPGENNAATTHSQVPISYVTYVGGIYILVQGAAEIWPEGCCKVDNVSHKVTEQYLFSKSYVVGEQQADPTEYPAGVRTFNFECPLPCELPSSLDLESSQITYSVQLTIERPWRCNDNFRQPLTILSVLDLNLHPDLKMPVNVEYIETFYGFSDIGRPLKLTYQMPVSGYVTGEKLPFTVKVFNTTLFDCRETTLQIMNYVSVVSLHRKIKAPLIRKWSVAETTLGPVPSESNRQFKGVIEIPTVLPSTCDSCRYIAGYYMVCVTVHTPFYHRNVQLETPLTIGTVPFQDIPGESSATMSLTQDNVEGIYILVQGAAKVRWTESSGKNSVGYRGLEQYLFSKTYVMGGQKADSTEYPAGTSTFKFQCLLPSKLPSSCSGEFGRIAYSVQLTIERPWRFDNNFQQPLTIVSVLDLNQYPGLKRPVNVEQIRNFYGLSFKAKPLKLTYQMSARGYVSKQAVPFTVMVENNSSFDCRVVKIVIKNYVEFTSQTPSIKSRKSSCNVAETTLGPIPRESNRKYKGVIKLPALASSTFQRCIYILLKGTAEVKWTRGSGRNKTTYLAKDIYFETRTYLIGSAGAESTEFPPGVHTYTFQVPLPAAIPSSLLSEDGKIRYYVKLVIDRPWRFDNEFKTGFTVIAPFDLNYYPKYKLPLELSATKEEQGCLCCICQMASLKINCRIPYQAYVSGQRVPYRVTIENETDMDISLSKASLKKYTRVTSDTPGERENIRVEKLLQSILGPIPKQSTKQFEGDFPLPCLPPSSLNRCRIIETRYVIFVRVCLPWYHKDLILEVPLVIGTQPLLETFNPQDSSNQHGSFTYEYPFVVGSPEYMQEKNVTLIPKYPMFHQWTRSADKSY